MFNPFHVENSLELRFHQFLQEGTVFLLDFHLLVHVVQIVGVAVLELLLHENLLDMPGLDVLDLQNRSDTVAVDKLAEFLSVVESGLFLEGEVYRFTLVHGNGPVVVIESQSFPYFGPYFLYFAIVEVVLLEVVGNELLLELIAIEEISVCFVADVELFGLEEVLLNFHLGVHHVLKVVVTCLLDLGVNRQRQLVPEVAAHLWMVYQHDHPVYRNDREVLQILQG